MDPCQHLCLLFTAESHGNGFDLCPPQYLSTCHDEFCNYLYWSRTDAGEPGIVFSLNVTELTREEQQRPLSCIDAHIIWSQT